jgi:hypothetical protein
MPANTTRFGNLAGLIFSTCLALPLISTQAHAQIATVSVGRITYELSTFVGSYNNNTLLFQSQPWWNSSSTALDFANALAPVTVPNSPYYLFAFSSSAKVNVAVAVNSGYTTGSNTYVGLTSVPFSHSSIYEPYVTATRSASSVPEINAGSLSQALLILFALWLVTRPNNRPLPTISTKDSRP